LIFEDYNDCMVIIGESICIDKRLNYFRVTKGYVATKEGAGALRVIDCVRQVCVQEKEIE
jgi:hypothetical protein